MNNTFTLKQIADKTNDDIIIDIPALQRGLVWKPKQVEFLWDSILRGFPIGGFVLSENVGKLYDLMDGQQRFDAIRLGFEEPEKNSKSILWIDIDFKQTDEPKSTRKFFVKATTIAHPWGYNNDDECKLLTAKERKDALGKFGFSKGTNIYINSIDLLKTYPYKSKFPIPFSYILTSINKNKKVFVSNVIEKCKKSNCSTWISKFWIPENINKLKKWLQINFETFLLLNNYTLPFSLLPKSTIDNEDKIENYQENEQTDLEILFQRLNTGGTKISPDDLRYSAIKAYWGSIKDKNEELAAGLMPPQYLIQILFRLKITELNSEVDKFESPLSIQKIRNLAKDNEKHNKIDSFFNSESIKEIKVRLLELTKPDNSKYAIPKYVLMKIVKEKPDLILFAMYLIKNQIKVNNNQLIGLILYLYWFSFNTTDVINTLYKKLKKSSDIITSIKEGIAELTYEKKIQNIYSPDELKKLVNNSNGHLIDNLLNTPAGKFIHSITWEPQKYSTSKTILLYAQRDYLSENFKEYNPSDTLAWEDHNCPWDYDHIFPQNKLNTFKQSQYREIVKFWLWSIGNFAAIPFEENRAKSDSDNYDYYKDKERESKLFFNSDFEIIEPQSDDEAEKTSLFERTVFNRMIELYTECYKAFENFIPDVDYAEKAKERKNFMEKLQEKIHNKCPECKTDFYFVREPYETQEYRLYEECPQDWFRFCVSLKANISKLNNPDCMISFTWNSINDRCEFGLRGTNKAVDKAKFLETNNCSSILETLIKDYQIVNVKSRQTEGEWWYRYYSLNATSVIDEFLDSLSDLYVSLYKELS
ncbi:DUF262 domain-containing protein [Treponema sp.]|uniref:DUF262 domain-containing protein n=1 Tax=Treponema sp. TaxID=166 RepID=UPI00257BC0C9|nr:DUF262 domain-containing protein [Treponema sp.]MBE6353965.1 DUF262 domain-containing protein [Treponema sp.]